jgi:hypothetical protein
MRENFRSDRENADYTEELGCCLLSKQAFCVETFAKMSDDDTFFDGTR